MSDKTSTIDFPRGILILQPAVRGLAGAAYPRLDHQSGLSASELLKLHGVGPMAIRIIQQALKDAGKAPLSP